MTPLPEAERFHFITPHRVIEIAMVGPFSNGAGYDREHCELRLEERGARLGLWHFRISSTAKFSDRFMQDPLDQTLLSIVRERIRNEEFGGQIDVVTSNLDELLNARQYGEEELEFETAKLAWRWNRELNGQPLSISVLADSLGADSAEIKRVMHYFNERGLVVLGAADTFTLQPGTIAELEGIIERGQIRRFPPIGYFREVPLPQEFRSPYVFVLMSFREEEFPQGRYSNIIKPIVEQATSKKCWRADEKQDQYQLTDLIYTMIAKAEVVVADISTQNENVFVEIGVALANHKKVYLFYDKGMRTTVPFYLNKIPYDFYGSEEELKSKLERRLRK